MRTLTGFASALVALLLLPGLAAAQGSIGGLVRDSSGAVLPGVTVEATSPAMIAARSVVTDGSGQYKILDLRPGIYAVTFTLTGFSTVKREGVELVGAFAALANAELRVGSVTETITVTGEAPVVDVQSVTRQRVFTKEVVDAIPAGRSYIDLAGLVPGLSASQPGRGTLADIGGTNNLQNTTFTIHGGRTSDTRLMIDGVRIGNVAGNGEYQNFSPDQGSTQEATIDYSSGSAEQMTAGVRIDLIPREGGNTFRGTVFAYGVNSAWQGDNLTEELKDRGLPAPNLMKRAYDINPSFGGPLKRNSLWFYSSARFQENQNYIAGLYYNANAGDPTKWLYLADTSRQGFFSLKQKSGNTRITWQAAPKHKLTFFYDNQGRVWDDGRASVSPESFVAYRFPKLRVVQSGWSSPLTSRLLLEARYSNRGEAFFNEPPPEGDVFRRLIPVTEQSSGLFYRGKGGDGGVSGTFGSTDQNIHTVLTSLAYVTGAHAFKVGFTDTFASTTGWSVSNDYNLAFRFNNGIPNQLTMYGTPTTSGSKLLGEIGVYAQDRWTVNRVTLNLGVRYDQFKSGYPVQHLGPAMYQPTRDLTFPETVGSNFKDLTPKLGAAYDLFGTGKTALKVNLGKYIGAVGGVGNPAGITNTVMRTWTDANGNFSPDCNLLNLQPQDLRASGGDFCSVVSSLNFGLPTSVTAFNPDTRFGWGHRTFSWEFSTSVQHQLAPRVSMDFGYFRRWYGNFTTNDNRAVETSDYSPFSVTAPLDPRLPDGGGYVVSGNYNLNPDKSGQTDNYTTFSSDYGNQYEHWNGVDLTINARLQNGIMVQGGLSTGRTSTDTCDLASKLDNPSQLYCHVDTKLLTQLKLIGTYTLPKGGVRVAATLQSFPGPGISAQTIFTNAQVQPSLGRPLSGNATNVTVNIVEPGTMYGDRANQLDVRISKIFNFGRVRTTANLDLSNALNVSPVMQQNNNFAVWQTPQRIMDARMFKLSAQLDF